MESQSRELTESSAHSFNIKQPQVAGRRPLNVLMDCRKLGEGGIGVYVDNLVRNLLKTEKVQISVLGNKKRIEKVDWSDDVTVIEDDTARYSMGELFGLARRVDFSNFDLFHTPHYILPYGVRIATIVTIHDLIHIEHPQRFYYPYIAMRLMRSSIRRATSVVAVSEATKRGIVDLIGKAEVYRKKIHVIPNSINPSLTQSEGNNSVARRAQELRPYILCVASQFKPHKGLIDLLEAYALLKERGINDKRGVQQRIPRLVFVGQGMEAVLNNSGALERFGAIDSVHIEGSVSKDELASWYKAARVVVVPSKAEGFCLPLLEAQSFGIPSVVRPVPAIQELLGPGDFVAKDFSVSSLADAMAKALSEESQFLGKPLTQHLSRFAPESLTQNMLDLYWQAVIDTAERR